MKLKRFLLRYEPPGVGLELARKDGELDVRHKDLPYKEQVHSSTDIYSLVDELLKSEPELLTQQKHQRALLQLLGRLYQLEVPLPPPEASTKDKKSKKASDDNESPSARAQGGDEEDKGDNAEEPLPESAHAVGTRVVLVNLKNKHVSHNGTLATVKKVTHGGRKYDVETTEGETFTVKGANHLVPLAEDPRNFVVGTQVAICGLRNHAALNGQICRVIEYNDASQRWEVRAIDSGQLFRVKPENIAAIQDDSAPLPASPAMNQVSHDVGAPLAEPLDGANPTLDPSARFGEASPRAAATAIDPSTQKPPEGAPPANPATTPGAMTDPQITEGCVVVLTGLKNAAWLNGEKADVLAVDLERHRYEIRLKVDNSVKKVRAENCQLFNATGAPASGTPVVAPVKAAGDSPAASNDPFRKGGIVQLCGLRSSPGLNGQRCEILRHDAATDRYEIRLEMDSSVKKVRRENLEPISDGK